MHRTTQLTDWDASGPYSVFASYTLTFALKLRKKKGKPLNQGSRRVPVGTVETEYTEQSIHNNKNTKTYRMKQKYTKHTNICTMIRKRTKRT